MSREAVMERVERVGRALAARGLGEHAREARIYYLALKHGLASAELTVALAWSPAVVEEWARLLGEVEADTRGAELEVRLPGVPCLRCKPGKGGRPEALRDGMEGALVRMRCTGCGARWLLEPTPAASPATLRRLRR